MTQKPRQHTVQFNYRSGQSVVVKCVDFRITNGGRTYEWEDMHPQPMKLSPEDIESVWVL